MDKLILICFCFALLTSHLQYVSSESETEESEKPVLVVLPKKDLLDSDSITQGQQNQNLLPALSTDNELLKSRNNPNKDDIKEQLPVLNTYAENDNESNTNRNGVSVSTKPIDVTNSNTNSEDRLPPIFIDFESDIEKKNDVNRSSVSNTNKNSGLAQPEKPFLPLGNTSADDETTTDTTSKDNDDWFYQEKNNDDDDEDYTENDGNKDDSEEYKDEGDDFVLGEHDNDDDDEEYDVTKWTQHGGGDDEDDTDWDDETADDFDESKSHLIDELAKKNKQPTAPTRMVLFYTWMIVAVLLIVVGVSTYQSRCKGFRFFGTKASNPKDDRKRLMEHEFV